MERHEAEQQKKKADMLSVPFATLNQLLLYLLAPPFKNMMRSGRWVAYSWYINEDIIDINVFQASPLHMPRCRISFLSELRLARTGLQNMLLCWLHSILFKRRSPYCSRLLTGGYRWFSSGFRILLCCWSVPQGVAMFVFLSGLVFDK
ncbi:uncharacterized protein [Lolium perenne]|uniref:uncharacterized protein isoform X1 n=1 Tax=Lolium perenne TaxID=4522 RepID=UPI0021F57C4D|nr:uncharacterized protein LOC127303377 [Lolium perenne]